VRGSIALTIVSTASGQAIQPAWHTDEVHGGQSYGWAWWLTGIFGPFVTMSIANIIIAAAAGGAADALALSPGGSIPIPLALPGLSVTDVQIDTDQLLLEGAARALVTPWDGLSVQLAIASEGVGEGTRVSDGYHRVGCPNGDYSYAATEQAQRVTVTATPRLPALPVTYLWSIAGFNAPIAVTGSGTATLSATCDYPNPPPVRSEV